MDSEVPKKTKKLDFYRPTFNEPLVQLPIKDNSTLSAPELSASTNSFADDEQSQGDHDSLFAAASSITASTNNENVSVFLRVRPINPSDLPCNLYKFDKLENKVIIKQPKCNTVSNNTEKHFQFTSILERTGQVETYNKTVRPILTNPFEIPGATFASYGCSNSGKTYSILGEESSAGLVPRAITQIFTEYEISPYPCFKIVNDRQLDIMDDLNVVAELEVVDDFLSESRKAFKGKDRPWNHEKIVEEHNFQEQVESGLHFKRIFVWVSMVEIYNEKLTDLFNTQKGTSRPLKIYSNAGQSYVQGATWLYVKNIKQAFEVLNQGLNRISYASTGVNAHSSRSHTIFTINLIGELLYGSEFHIASFKFCDLAGAERVRKTGNVGERLKEAGLINTSLLVLGRCLESVIQNQKKTNKKQPDAVVPVRDSKLTYLIQKSLLGREKFLMVVNLCPSSEFFEENLNVLKFGSIANQIVVKKSELRKYKRQSIRYSFFNTDTASPKKNLTLNNSSIDESELDDSYNWNMMSHHELINNLRLQQMEINLLKEALEEREREALLKCRAFRKEIVDVQEIVRQKHIQRNEENEELLKSYHEKMLASQKTSYERKLNEAYMEIERLEKYVQKYGNLHVNNEESYDDEIYEIEDD